MAQVKLPEHPLQPGTASVCQPARFLSQNQLWALPLCECFCASLLFCVASSAPGQELFHATLPRTIEVEPLATSLESAPYTFKTGDFRLLVTPSLEADWVDNIDLAPHGGLQDFILRPLLQLDGTYPVSQLNLLQFNVGIGYDIYTEHSQFDALRLVSGSQISFDTYVKDFVFNVHDRFHYIEDPAEQAAVATTARFGGLYNTAGLSATWDQQDLLFQLGYDHENFVATSGAYDYLNRGSELLSGRAGFRIHPQILTGLETGGSFTRYDQNFLNDSTGYRAGLFGQWRPGRYLKVEGHAGYQAYLFDQTSSALRAIDQYAWYGSLIATHQLTDFFNYSLDVGRELRLGTEADFIKAWYARPAINWRPLNQVQVQGYLSFEHGDQGQAQQGGGVIETYDWLGFGFVVSRPVLGRLNAAIRYRHTLRGSDLAGREYSQNLIGLILTYPFQ
jgi:hypothetical protein